MVKKRSGIDAESLPDLPGRMLVTMEALNMDYAPLWLRIGAASRFATLPVT